MIEKQDKFHSLIVEYLQSMEMIPLSEAYNKSENSEYQHIYFMLMRTFTKQDDDVPHQIMVKTEVWQNFLSTVGIIFEGKINQKLVQRTISSAIGKLTEWPLQETTLSEYAQSIGKILFTYYEARFQAFITVGFIANLDHQLLEVPLAKSVLHFGRTNSDLAQKLSNPDIEKSFPNEEIPRDSSYLAVEVFGDQESITAQTHLEAHHALLVLRFVTGWYSRLEGVRQVSYNPAMRVNNWSEGHSYIVYFDPQSPEKRAGVLSRNRSHRMSVSLQWLDSAKHYGLEDINYHFQSQQNPISIRVTRALELYDSATLAHTDWQAMYRYVACIDVALSSYYENKNKLQEKLEKLIKFGGNYIGSIAGVEDNGNIPDTYTWDDLVTRVANPFHKFYTFRNDIIHGTLTDMTEENIEGARILAHNTVRLVAKVAREFNWQAEDDAKQWFNTPVYPPSLPIVE